MFMGSYCEITREQLETASSKKYPYMKTKQPASENKFYTYERPIIITKTTTKKTTKTTTTTEAMPILDEFLQELPKIEFPALVLFDSSNNEKTKFISSFIGAPFKYLNIKADKFLPNITHSK